MPPKYVYFDHDEGIVEAFAKQGFESIRSDVRQVEADIIVSPANSYGWMDGGIDFLYMKMFEDIERNVREEIKKIGINNAEMHNNYLPIGSAFRIKVTPKKGQTTKVKELVVAPTMFTPMDIEGTPQNVYYAMIAVFYVTYKLPKECVVAIPGMGTGCGHLSGDTSARQCKKAHDDFFRSNRNIVYENEDVKVLEEKEDRYILSRMACLQLLDAEEIAEKL